MNQHSRYTAGGCTSSAWKITRFGRTVGTCTELALELASLRTGGGMGAGVGVGVHVGDDAGAVVVAIAVLTGKLEE